MVVKEAIKKFFSFNSATSLLFWTLLTQKIHQLSIIFTFQDFPEGMETLTIFFCVLPVPLYHCTMKRRFSRAGARCHGNQSAAAAAAIATVSGKRCQLSAS